MENPPNQNTFPWETFKLIAEIIGAVVFLLSIFTGPWGFQIPELPYYSLLVASSIVGLIFVWIELKRWETWKKSLLSVVAIAIALGLGYGYWRLSRPSFEITTLNTLPNDPQAYEITDYLIWNQDQAALDNYKVKTNFEIQVVPNYIGKSRFGEVVVRISSAPGSDQYIEQTLWMDFDADAQSQKIKISLADLVKYSGIQENLGLENRLDQFDYRQGKLYIQIFPIKEPATIWKMEAITIRNAPWDQRIDVVWRNGHNDIDVYLKNYGGPSEFFTHYKLVRLDDAGSTPLEHGTNSATTKIEGSIINVEPRTLDTNRSTTFSIPLGNPPAPGRYAVEVYTVKRQRFVNWDVAYPNVSWWFAPASQVGYFIVTTSGNQANSPTTPFEAEAVRLKTEQGIDLGLPTGPVEDVKSQHDLPGQRQVFTNGMVIIYNGQAYSLYGPVYQHYKALDNGYFPTSQITTIQRNNAGSVDMMEFEPVGESDMPSVIYANAQYAAWMEGWVRNLYEKSDGVNGWLGLPVSDLMSHADSNSQAFENGYIVYYFPEVNGEHDYNRPPVILPYVTTFGGDGKIFDVQAAPWQDTGLEVNEGDIIWIEYIGGGWTDNTETNPDGYSANGNGLLGYAEGALSDKAVVGALIARVGGENGRVYTIGRWVVIIAPTSGKLELAMNDNNYENNAGLVTVKIDITTP